MSEKHRNLPLWMVKSGDQNSTVKDAVRKKTQGITKKRPKSVIEYWMNEKELVETAVSLLTEFKVCARDAVKPSEVIPETDAEISDSEVSNIDRDVAEQETVPYENCVTEGTSTKLDSHYKPRIISEASQKKKPQKPDVSDDEALELVREIFFTSAHNKIT